MRPPATRARAPRVPQADAALIEKLRAIKAEHPFWGWRRAGAWLRFHDGLAINKKREERVMRENGLMVKPNDALRANARQIAKNACGPPQPVVGHRMTK